LQLALNAFSGPLPFQSVPDLDTKLVEINLASNAFTGTIPNAWSNFTALHNVFLAANYLEGTLPDSFAKLELQQIDVAGNWQITGSLPHAWALNTSRMYQNLLSINVAYTQIHGPFPSNWVDGFRYLVALNLAVLALAMVSPTTSSHRLRHSPSTTLRFKALSPNTSWHRPI